MYIIIIDIMCWIISLASLSFMWHFYVASPDVDTWATAASLYVHSFSACLKWLTHSVYASSGETEIYVAGTKLAFD